MRYVQSEEGNRLGKVIEELEGEVICGSDDEEALLEDINKLQAEYYSIEGTYFRSIYAN